MSNFETIKKWQPENFSIRSGVTHELYRRKGERWPVYFLVTGLRPGDLDGVNEIEFELRAEDIRDILGL